MFNWVTFLFYRFEETYFTRLPSTRQDRHKSRQQYSSTAFADEMIGSSSNSKKDGGKRKGSGGKRGNLLILNNLWHSIFFYTLNLFFEINRWVQEEEEELARNLKPFDCSFSIDVLLVYILQYPVLKNMLLELKWNERYRSDLPPSYSLNHFEQDSNSANRKKRSSISELTRK